MQQVKCRSQRFRHDPLLRFVLISIVGIGTLWSFGRSMAQQPGQETFSSADDASRALFTAVQGDDLKALSKILGPAGEEVISSGDDVEDKNGRSRFVGKYKEMHRLAKEPDGTTTLYIGAENWPMPIPLVSKNGAFYYDTEAGKQEILFRRIGRNELAAIRVCREFVDAQKEYDAQFHDGEPVKHYARKFVSDEGKHNGLYWKPSGGEPVSPIGPLIASASYDEDKDQNIGSSPFQGYYYRILTKQGTHAKGGATDYIVGGKMTRGFAFLAYPAGYRNSGVMTFIVNQDGVVYQKDLGPKTAEAAKAVKAYDPDPSWKKAE